MKIVIIGATGFVGSAILAESLQRGHAVTAVVSRPEKLPAYPQLTAAPCDVADTTALTAILAGHALVMSAFNPGKDARGTGAGSIIAAVKHSGVERLLVVGGAGSLEVAPGQRLVDQPDFPAEWKAGSLKTAAVLNELRQETVLNWTFLCPAALLMPGKRTGHYRVGGDQLLKDADGKSQISVEDYAVAMLDEAETPRHPRARFSVDY